MRGSQEPTHLVVPDAVTSEWEDCHAINAIGKLNLLEWQDRILEGWLGRNALGRWAAQTCGGSIPRQNGKTLGVVVPRCNYGMIAHGEEIIYTSHLQKTSTETFESVAENVTSERETAVLDASMHGANGLAGWAAPGTANVTGVAAVS